IASVPAEHKRLERKHQCLKPQNQGMHKRESIHSVKKESSHRTRVLRRNRVVVVGIGVGNAAAARGHAIESAIKERLKIDQKSARTGHLLWIKQLPATAELSGGDKVLHVCDHHRNNGPRFGYACSFGHHPDLHDLRFDLSKTSLEESLPGAFGDQDPCGPHQWIDNIADAERKLLDLTADAGPNNRLVQIDLCLRQRGFSAVSFSRKYGRYAFLRAPFRGFCRRDRTKLALRAHLEPLDFAEGNVARVAPEQLLLGFQFIHGRLVIALGLLELT